MANVGQNWECPYCGFGQVVSQERSDKASRRLEIDGEAGGLPLTIGWNAVVCTNDECRKLSLGVYIGSISQNHASGKAVFNPRNSWRLLPASSARPQPDCVPEALRGNYYEACAIRDLSPKASATLSRRCLQGMIRDFCKIAKGTLDAEIKALRAAVDEGRAPAGVTPESVDAIDHVRSLGNIGAHFEKDVDLIIEIDPDEAQALIDLVETLFAEWYVERKQRQDRLAKVAAIVEQKKQERVDAKALTNSAAQGAIPLSGNNKR